MQILQTGHQTDEIYKNCNTKGSLVKKMMNYQMSKQQIVIQEVIQNKQCSLGVNEKKIQKRSRIE